MSFLSTLWNLLYTYVYLNKYLLPRNPSTPFPLHTILVTGSNTGLGLAAGKKFAGLGASHLILGVRNPSKGAAAKRLIEAHLSSSGTRGSGGTTGCVISVWPLDMDSYDSIKAFAGRAAAELERLDVVVLNAGVSKRAFERSQYGWEETLQVNVLSTTLLALLLLPTLQRAKGGGAAEVSVPTLEIVSSGWHYRVELGEEEKGPDACLLERYNRVEGFVGGKQYGLSKLFMMYALEGLVRLVASSKGEESAAPDVWVTAVCPGACQTEIAREYNTGIGYRLLLGLWGFFFMRTAEQGARTLISGCTLGERGHGRFWQHDVIRERAPLLEGEQGSRLQEKVWHEILEALRKDVPEVVDLVRSR